jgi:hypothetical protein
MPSMALEESNDERAAWISAFTGHAVRLRPDDGPKALADLAREVYPHLGHLDPFEVAHGSLRLPTRAD